MEKPKKVIIIGAGPGGLSAGMILAHRGCDVSVYECKSHVGGRNFPVRENGYTFELGPTFVMLPKVFEDIFELAGEKLSDHLDFIRLDPMYQLSFADGRRFDVHYDKEKLKREIERLFPGEAPGYDRYFRENTVKFDRLYPCLEFPYSRFYYYLKWKFLKALPVMDPTLSVHDVLSRYFKSEDLKISMSFQAKYLGMSPWDCPGAFTILSYVEHAFGIYHPRGGVYRISEAMGEVFKKKGGKLFLNHEVESVIFEGKKAVGVKFADGREARADAVVMNADFAHGMSKLIPEKLRKKYSDRNLLKKKYSCSTFMMYLGISEKKDVPHHSIFLSEDYRTNVEDIFKRKTIPKDPSFYVQNACINDPSLAPEGKSTIYVLVPVPNTIDSKVDWEKEKGPFREHILELLEARAGFKNIRSHIEFEKVMTPLDWGSDENVFNGAVFNLAHSINQMLYLRPRNKLEGYKDLYLVGGGTHPGSGLPTILESGRITANIIAPH